MVESKDGIDTKTQKPRKKSSIEKSNDKSKKRYRSRHHSKPRDRSNSKNSRHRSRHSDRHSRRSKHSHRKSHSSRRKASKHRENSIEKAPPQIALPRRNSLWDQTPTQAQKNGGSISSLLVKMPDGTFANAPTVMGASSFGSGFQSKVSPGTLDITSDVLNMKKQAKRVVIANLPEKRDINSLRTFLNTKIAEKKNVRDAVTSIFINQMDGKAYAELSTEDCALFALSLNGVLYDGNHLSISRLHLTATTGAAQGIAPTATAAQPDVSGVQRYVPDGAGKIFCAGLPPELTDHEVKELLCTHGPLNSFFLPKESTTGKSKGYCFFVYEDLSVTQDAIKGLNGIQIGDYCLTLKLHSVPDKDDPASALKKAQEVLLKTAASEKLDSPSRVLCFMQMVTKEALEDDREYEEILEDIKSECENYGRVLDIKIPRPDRDMEGIGKVFVKFKTISMAKAAKESIEGRTFDRRIVYVKFFNEKNFDMERYNKQKAKRK